MKVVHVTEAFEGGVIEFLRNLTISTPEINHIIIYGRQQFFYKAKSTFPSSVKFIFWQNAVTKISFVQDAKSLSNLIRLLKQEKPFDVLHLHSAKANIIGRIAAKKIGFKEIIYTPHGATFLRQDVSALTRNFFKQIEKSINIIPATIVGVSKSEAEAYHKIGLKATYINNGKIFSHQFIKKNISSTFKIVSIGRATTQKNPALFNLIASSFINNKNTEFIWVGDGHQRNLLSSPNIKITGWIDKADVEKFLTEADLYISTALWEGLPYAVLEAMNMQLPLLLSNCEGNIDCVQDNVNGFLFNSAEDAVDKINQYINNTNLLKLHGEASLKILQQNFSAELMAAGYRKIYAEL